MNTKYIKKTAVAFIVSCGFVAALTSCNPWQYSCGYPFETDGCLP